MTLMIHADLPRHGQISESCPAPFAKIFHFALTPNQQYIAHRPVPQRGVAQRHQRGSGCGGRRCAKDDSADLRTAKSCGPGAPTLVSSWRNYLRRRRWQKSPVTGESTKETVKTIARGMPGDSGVTVVTNACAFYTTHAAAGASSARHSLRPLI
jgi:hypothetical protein